MHAQIVGTTSTQIARLTAGNIGEREAERRRHHQRALDRSDSFWADFVAVVSIATVVALVIYMLLSRA